MASGGAYPHVADLVGSVANDGLALELGSGSAARYRQFVGRCVATDLPGARDLDAVDMDLCCDAHRLPFSDESFDCVFTVAALYLMSDPPTVCREAHRVLRRGGRILVFDYTIGTKVRARLRNWVKGRSRLFHHWTQGGLQTLLTAAGFSDVTTHFATPRQARIASAGPGVGDVLCQWLIVSGEKG